ncbi:callose synthase 9 [Carex littledalei]|uniref:1,3-beta-glucan synthase n=1 Tax=Carex littledalei TaxID=544730 RepID=A0A833QLW3_9POAL|nr:callose synthase 9 [Carex littledalei]
MERAETNWERLVRAALRSDRGRAGTYGIPVTGIAGAVPTCLGNNVHIEEILRAADEIQDEDPRIARILCEHAYSLAQKLDPNSEGRGVLQFKTGLMSVIRQKLAKKEVGAIDRSQDIARLLEFYKRYREKNKVDELREEEKRLRESVIYTGNLGELERKSILRKRVHATLRVLGTVVQDLTKELSPDAASGLISEEEKRMMEKDAEMTEDVVAYNIIPIDCPTTTNDIVSFSEVRAAISALQYFRGLPRLPSSVTIPEARNADMMDFLQYVFGFQKDSVSNQRENVVHLLANEQSRLGKPSENEPKIDDHAVRGVFYKCLDNYIKWCEYLPIRPVWSSTNDLEKERMLLYVCLYFLIWGEGANVRFLPECICYIFHHMAREMDEIMREQTAKQAASCVVTATGETSFLDQVVSPLYGIVAAVSTYGNLTEWDEIRRSRANGRLFANIRWPKEPHMIEMIKRLHSLLTIKESAASVPKNLEARRRLQFFTNSLFMRMPAAKPVSEMLSFSVFTPYYSETVLYTLAELQVKNEDGISLLFYLQKIFPDEWKNFLYRIGRDENSEDSELFDSPNDILELRFWASYRGQTLARTVRGMMYYRKALMLQSYIEKIQSEAALNGNASTETQGFELSPYARAQADLKFTYVVTCQIYGKQKAEGKPQAADIALLMQRNEAFRVAFIDEVEMIKNGKTTTEYYSKLEIYSIKLPGQPKLGEGKPENQNHAIVFTRGNAVQTIDMNQDNYFEEALKMRNLLEEFHGDYGLHKVSILGVREHVFTGSVSSLALFMSNQETSFVTLGQRVLCNPLKVRMHYGHPDVFDRVFHITRGGISKASRVINISEDIYAGFNSTLRQGNITHHEYIQVGKGRDVGLNQIALFEGKVAGGNGEQVLSRDVYRLGQLFDFFRMMSFYVTTVGFYFCTMLTVLTVYIFLYGKTYLALSGIGESIQTRADVLDNTALNAALNTQFLFQIGMVTAVPMILGFILEQGFLSAVVSFTTMQMQLCSVFFTFSLGTRTHYFGRTILHGGAKYRATGRGFVVRHIKFAENYRLYSRSHFVKGC